MTGRRFHRTTEAIPRRPWKFKCPFFGRAREIRRGTSSIHSHLLVPRSSSHIGPRKFLGGAPGAALGSQGCSWGCSRECLGKLGGGGCRGFACGCSIWGVDRKSTDRSTACEVPSFPEHSRSTPRAPRFVRAPPRAPPRTAPKSFTHSPRSLRNDNKISRQENLHF